MQPHEQRVIDEKAELNTKIEKLAAFTLTPTFSGLDPIDAHLLLAQWECMSSYSGLLQSRIARFRA